MLVLTRKANEQILIGDDIKITLVRVRGNSVRIGIEAPRDKRVVRGEIADKEPQRAKSAEQSHDILKLNPDDQQDTPVTKGASSDSQPRFHVDRADSGPKVYSGRVRCDNNGNMVDVAPLARFMTTT